MTLREAAQAVVDSESYRSHSGGVAYIAMDALDDLRAALATDILDVERDANGAVILTPWASVATPGTTDAEPKR